jgi:patatin-related protein
MAECTRDLEFDKDFTPIQEIRFAVVMYGGVSLAIYMNGITTELLNMVRASEPSHTPVGTEIIYRRLAEKLRSRFVIDVLSGTSAGGINAIYLAKALANDQDIRELTNLWITEGDITVLINDKKSVEQTPLEPQSPPESLMNGERMYWKLLEAFNGMGPDPKKKSPYVEELDLFVTTTDIEGLTVPIRLADKVVFERRHRNDFHFAYSTTESSGENHNDFMRQMNPFLAFAARCTSAFPFAFEPMQLSDMDAVLDALPGEKHSKRSSDPIWPQFFPAYEPAEIATRAFGDGGYLDNKPFSYATDTLVHRHAILPVIRKLIYIEPAPEHPELRGRTNAGKPNFVQNVIAATLTLPSYEPIRADLQKVVARNHFISRVNEITDKLEADASKLQDGLEPSVSGDEYVKTGLTELIKRRGVAYGAYHRLKVATVTDDLTRLVTRVLRLKEDSDEFLAVRYFIKAWRLQHYDEDPLPGWGKEPEPAFLLRYDIGYRTRRLEFLRTKIDELNCLNERSQQILRAAGLNYDLLNASAAERDEFRRSLGHLQADISRIYRALRVLKHKLWAFEGTGLEGQVQALGIGRDTLESVLAIKDDPGRLTYAGEHTREHDREFQVAADELARRLKDPLIKAAKDAELLLSPVSTGGQETPTQKTIRQCLWHYYRFYEDYDFVRFPIFYCTDAGEAVPIDVIRISPDDTLTDLRNGNPNSHKLAGTALAHFGAFVEKLWRQNDIMWGRLDAAERLITTLWPGGQDCEGQKLINCAHKIILEEELRTVDRGKVYELLAQALAESLPGQESLAELQKIVQQQADTPLQQKLQSILQECIKDEDSLLNYIRKEYQVNPRPDTERALLSMARSTRVISRMVENLTRREDSAVAKWFTRLGQWFWGLVEVAIPGSLSHAFFRRAVSLLYLFAVLMIAGGWLSGVPAVINFGWAILAATAVVNIVALLLGDAMRGKQRGRRIALLFVGAIVLVLIILGVLQIVRWWPW